MGATFEYVVSTTRIHGATSSIPHRLVKRQGNEDILPKEGRMQYPWVIAIF